MAVSLAVEMARKRICYDCAQMQHKMPEPDYICMAAADMPVVNTPLWQSDRPCPLGRWAKHIREEKGIVYATFKGAEQEIGTIDDAALAAQIKAADKERRIEAQTVALGPVIRPLIKGLPEAERLSKLDALVSSGALMPETAADIELSVKEVADGGERTRV